MRHNTNDFPKLTLDLLLCAVSLAPLSTVELGLHQTSYRTFKAIVLHTECVLGVILELCVAGTHIILYGLRKFGD